MRSLLELPLKEFLESFHTPQVGRLLRGVPQSLADDVDIDLGPGAVLKFHRKVSPNVPVTFLDPWSRRQDHWIKVTLPIDYPGSFRLLPYDPASGDTSADHIYDTVADLIKAFPVYVKANAEYNSSEEPRDAFVSGDILKLIRVVYKNDSKLLECRLVHQCHLLQLPMSCRGNFTVMTTNNEYLLADLVSLVPRKRRVAIKPDTNGRITKIPGLPSDYQGDLFINEPEYFVEASPVNDPSIIIGLPHNLDMTVSPDDMALERGLLLNSFATNSRNLFPVAVNVSDWDEETTILENHFIKPGVELVIHGWTRQSKVLAHAEGRDKMFAIPLTYQGKFRMKSQEFRSVAELENAHPAYKLRVIGVDLTETDCPLAKDDIVRIKRSESMKKPKAGEVKHLKVEKLYSKGTTRWKEHKIPITARIMFEEIIEDAPDHDFHIKDLVTFVTDHPVTVQITQRSPDQKIGDRDLPRDEPINLTDFVVEPAVYVSVGAADAPAFHIPLRTLLYVDFVEQLDRSSSPLLTKQSPKLSTLDRCVERLSGSTYQQLIATKSSSSTPFPNFQRAKVFSSPSATDWSSVSKPERSNSSEEARQISPAGARTNEKITVDVHSPTELNGHHSPRLQVASPTPSEPVRASAMYSSQTNLSTAGSLHPSEYNPPPGYVLMPTAQAQAIPAGFSLVPVMNPFQHHPSTMSYTGSVRGPPSTIADEDEDFDDLRSDISKFTVRKANSFKVIIPPNGNLYHYSCKKFIELLKLLKIEELAIRKCMRDKIDGKKFARMFEGDLEDYGILHPIVIYFRRNTSRHKAASSKFTL